MTKRVYMKRQFLTEKLAGGALCVKKKRPKLDSFGMMDEYGLSLKRVTEHHPEI